jgi:hypothetical protein
MFTHQTILLLRPGLPGSAALLPLRGHFRDYHFVQNVMEVKRHLLRCLRKLKPEATSTPDFILVDAGANSRDIRSELERWLESHPRLGRIKVIFPPPRPWVLRVCKRLHDWLQMRRAGLAPLEKQAAP